MRISDGSSDVCSSDLCLHRAEEDGFAALAAGFKKAVERRQRARPDFAVVRDVGIVARGAVERIERALKETGGGPGAPIHAGVEEFGGDPRRAQRDPVETGAQPLEAALDRRRLGARPIPTPPPITIHPRPASGNTTIQAP